MKYSSIKLLIWFFISLWTVVISQNVENITPKPANEKTTECPQVMCRMSCPAGYQKDENGCDICACYEAENEKINPIGNKNGTCPEFQCGAYCTHYKTDGKGCKLCACQRKKPHKLKAMD